MNMLAEVFPKNGHYEARLTCWPDYLVAGQTRESALSALHEAVNHKLEQGDVFLLSFNGPSIRANQRSSLIRLPARNIHDLGGIFKDDPTLMELCEEIYRERDEEKKREFPE